MSNEAIRCYPTGISLPFTGPTTTIIVHKDGSTANNGSVVDNWAASQTKPLSISSPVDAVSTAGDALTSTAPVDVPIVTAPPSVSGVSLDPAPDLASTSAVLAEVPVVSSHTSVSNNIGVDGDDSVEAPESVGFTPDEGHNAPLRTSNNSVLADLLVSSDDKPVPKASGTATAPPKTVTNGIQDDDATDAPARTSALERAATNVGCKSGSMDDPWVACRVQDHVTRWQSFAVHRCNTTVLPTRMVNLAWHRDCSAKNRARRQIPFGLSRANTPPYARIPLTGWLDKSVLNNAKIIKALPAHDFFYDKYVQLCLLYHKKRFLISLKVDNILAYHKHTHANTHAARMHAHT